MFRLDLKEFLFCENKVYLGQRIGDILSSLQDLEQNKGGMGTRQLVANADRIVGQIRKILHGTWSKKEQSYLKHLQKAAVGLARAIEEKDDLESTIGSVSNEIEDLMTKMKVPVNSLGSSEDSGDQDKMKDSNSPQLSPSQGQQPPQQKQGQQSQPPQDGQSQDGQQPPESQPNNPQNPTPQFQQPPS
jgi:FtsZ-interacting cell division protein ZipA